MNYKYYKIFYCVGKHKNITRVAGDVPHDHRKMRR